MRQSLCDLVIERVGFGIFVLDREMNVLMWNRFMQRRSATRLKGDFPLEIYALYFFMAEFSDVIFLNIDDLSMHPAWSRSISAIAKDANSCCAASKRQSDASTLRLA
jgi:hypothetical protein